MSLANVNNELLCEFKQKIQGVQSNLTEVQNQPMIGWQNQNKIVEDRDRKRVR